MSISQSEKDAILAMRDQVERELNNPVMKKMMTAMQAAVALIPPIPTGLAATVLANMDELQKQMRREMEQVKRVESLMRTMITPVIDQSMFARVDERFTSSMIDFARIDMMSRPRRRAIEKPEWTKISRPELKRTIGFKS